MARKPSGYTAEDIEILEDLSPILHRPGMYTDPVNPNHALVEVIDNSADEGLAGFATKVAVILYEDGSASVEDDGRGIPVDIHPKKKIPAVQVIFTTLHSGGKFRKTDKDAAYRIAGGLHGVGVCVSNALSKRLEVDVKRDGAAYRIVFADNGKVKEPLKKTGTAGPRDTGTRVRFWPDPKYFDSPAIVAADLAALLRAKAMLLPGVKFTLGIEKKGKIETQTWLFPEGIKGYFESAITGLEPVASSFFGERYIAAQSESDSFDEGEGAMWAIAWTPEAELVTESYVNMIPTRIGGTHVSGLREGVYNAIKNFIDLHAMGQRGLKVVPEDVWSRANFVLSVKMLDPHDCPGLVYYLPTPKSPHDERPRDHPGFSARSPVAETRNRRRQTVERPCARRCRKRGYSRSGITGRAWIAKGWLRHPADRHLPFECRPSGGGHSGGDGYWMQRNERRWDRSGERGTRCALVPGEARCGRAP
jgi:topoisomerase-4 subunit B